MYGGQSKSRKPKIKKQLENRIIRAVKDRTIRDSKKLFEQEDY